MSDEELRHKKESLAETAVVESILEEECEEAGLLCGDCGGILVVSVSAKPDAGTSFVEVCRDCGTEYEREDDE